MECLEYDDESDEEFNKTMRDAHAKAERSLVTKLEHMYIANMTPNCISGRVDESCMTVPARLAAARLLNPEMWARCPFEALMCTTAEVVKQSGSLKVLCHSADVCDDSEWESLAGIRFGHLSGDTCFKGSLLLAAERQKLPVSLPAERVPPLVRMSPGQGTRGFYNMTGGMIKQVCIGCGDQVPHSDKEIVRCKLCNGSFCSAACKELTHGTHACLVCAVCGKREGCRPCERCRGVVYCGTACQAADWPKHKRCGCTKIKTSGPVPQVLMPKA